MKIYLAGPMQGIAEFNFPLFDATADALRAKGHEVFNPAERDRERHGGVNIGAGNMDGDVRKAVATHGFSLNDALRDDTHFICTQADAIYLLPGWERSFGANAEWALAVALKRKIFYHNTVEL